jgi:hypothetical protein
MIRGHDAQSTIAALTTAAAVQAQAAGQHLLFEWGQAVLQRLHSVWLQMEAFEAMAYEDKVAAQVRTLDEAAGSLWHLRQALVTARRQLRRHQRELHRRAPHIRRQQTGNRTSTPGSPRGRHTEYCRSPGDNAVHGS